MWCTCFILVTSCSTLPVNHISLDDCVEACLKQGLYVNAYYTDIETAPDSQCVCESITCGDE